MILEFLANSVDTLRVIWKEDKLLWVGVLGRWMTRQLVFPHPPTIQAFQIFLPTFWMKCGVKRATLFRFFFPYCVILIEAGDDRFTPHISTNFFPPIVYRGEYNLSSPRLNFRSNVSEQNQMELTTTRMTNDSCNCGRSIILLWSYDIQQRRSSFIKHVKSEVIFMIRMAGKKVRHIKLFLFTFISKVLFVHNLGRLISGK